MLEQIIKINSAVNNFVWGVPAMICIIGVGLLLSCKTRFLQLRKFGYAMRLTIGRMFKKKDPKIYPPNWCPKLKKPCEFRVYDFKDANTWYLHTLLKRKSPPDGYQYAVRLSGTVNLTPSAFFSMAKRKGASELLGVMVKIGEIVEIDDGLTSNCFYLTLNGVKYLPYWDTARARKNEYACKNSDN